MNTRYKLVNWVFDSEGFARAVSSLLENFTKGELGEIVGVTPSCIDAWAKNRYKNEFNHPNMSNLIIICNQADLDPRDFFVLEDM